MKAGRVSAASDCDIVLIARVSRLTGRLGISDIVRHGEPTAALRRSRLGPPDRHARPKEQST